MNRNTAIRAVLISIVISALAVQFLTTQGKPFNLLEFYQQHRPDLLGLVLILASLLTWWLIGGIRIKLIADSLPQEPGSKPITISRATRAMLLSLFTAAVTPSVGSALGLVWYLSRYVSPRAATAVTIYSVVTDLVYYAWSLPVCYAILTVMHVNLDIPLVGPVLGVFAILASGLLIFFATALALRPAGLVRLVNGIFGVGFLKRFQVGADQFVRETADGLREISKLPWHKQLLLHLTTAASYVVHFLAFNVLVWAFGFQGVNHLTILSAQSLLVVLSLLVPTPGGAGYFEIALSKLFEVSGFKEDAILPLVFIWRLLSYYLYIVLGLLIGGSALFSNRKTVDGEASSDGSSDALD